MTPRAQEQKRITEATLTEYREGLHAHLTAGKARSTYRQEKSAKLRAMIEAFKKKHSSPLRGVRDTDLSISPLWLAAGASLVWFFFFRKKAPTISDTLPQSQAEAQWAAVQREAGQ